VASTLFGGVISLIVALVFLAILAAKIPSIPLWIVILTGVVAMVASLVEDVRSSNGAGGSS
jgi:hypothetical protein